MARGQVLPWIAAQNQEVRDIDYERSYLAGNAGESGRIL